MKHRQLITSCIVAFAASSHAAIIHTTSYEDETAAGFGIQPASMGFTDGGGDHIGQPGLGIATANPRTGTYSYVIESGSETVDNGNGWGGTWSGINTTGFGPQSSGIVDQATAEANATPAAPLSYVNVDEGCTFTVSGWVATDAADPASGGVVTAPRLEFHNAAGAELFRNQGTALGATDLTAAYQQMTHSYTLTAADIAAGVVRVTAVWGTDGQGFGNADGLIYVDDFSFEVDNASFITVIPEPSSSLLGVFGVLGLALRRRR